MRRGKRETDLGHLDKKSAKGEPNMRRVRGVSQTFPLVSGLALLYGTGRADWRIGFGATSGLESAGERSTLLHTGSFLSDQCSPLPSILSSKLSLVPKTPPGGPESLERRCQPADDDDELETVASSDDPSAAATGTWRAYESGRGGPYRVESVECRGPGRLTGDCERRSGGQTRNWRRTRSRSRLAHRAAGRPRSL